MRLRDDRRPGFRYHLKVHTFRIFTVLLAWGLVVAAFYQSPEMLTGVQRFLQHGIEALGDAIPSPWGPRIEFCLPGDWGADLPSNHDVRRGLASHAGDPGRDIAFPFAAREVRGPNAEEMRPRQIRMN
jgi:hypothetical protein